MEKLIEKSITATHESKYIEFKSEFDINSKQDWCEVIKDIIAISNSGGGVLYSASMTQECHLTTM